MPSTLGKTEICNIALRRIGVRPVNDVDKDTATAAIELRAVWNLAVQSILRLNEWNFATKIIALAEITNETIIGWDHLYMYPTDCVMAWSIETESSIRDSSISYEWENLLSPDTNTLVIVTDQANAYLRYTAMVTDPTKWDSNFVNALAWRLAYEVCQKLSADASLFQKCATMYTQAAAEAQTMDVKENNNPTDTSGPYVEVR